MYLVQTPTLVKSFFKDYIWHIKTDEPVVFLTFDDGPIDGLTPWVLDTLSNYKAKATFFCVGENIVKNQDIFYRLQSEGHTVGNHTHNHLNGWMTDTETYLENVGLCDHYCASPLFRPPYGKLKPSQSTEIRKHKTIVMWDVLSGDFDNNLSQEDCYKNIIDHYQKGSIIVLHDNYKSEKKLRYVLPKLLEHLYEKGFTCKNLDFIAEKTSSVSV